MALFDLMLNFIMSYCLIYPIIKVKTREKNLTIKNLLIIITIILFKELLFLKLNFFSTDVYILIDFLIIIFGISILPIIIFSENAKYDRKEQEKQILASYKEACIKLPENDNELVTPKSFNPMFDLYESQLIDTYIKREYDKLNIDKNLVHEAILKRKTIMIIIYSILLFAYITAIFFHFPILTYILGFIIILIIFLCTKKYDVYKYLKKEVISRPGEKISNIVMNFSNGFVIDNKKRFRLGILVVAIFLPLIIFYKPRILYEQTDGGYAVRYYIFGVSNFETASIPSTYKGKPVVSLRGNSFSNMFFLKKVTLPSTVKEIRGQAFLNDFSLTYVELPSELEYLGGGAFYNCTSLESIYLPDSITYLGGESFYGCRKLKEVNIPTGITEIRGDTFEYCTSLKKIEIPDNITRIGGHAFYGDTSLSEVTFTQNSRLKEIGSSAFRKCNNLKTIRIPKTTNVNFRAFKESPTMVNFFN